MAFLFFISSPFTVILHQPHKINSYNHQWTSWHCAAWKHSFKSSWLYYGVQNLIKAFLQMRKLGHKCSQVRLGCSRGCLILEPELVIFCPHNNLFFRESYIHQDLSDWVGSSHLWASTPKSEAEGLPPVQGCLGFIVNSRQSWASYSMEACDKMYLQNQPAGFEV